MPEVHSQKETAAMDSVFNLPTLLLILIASPILVSPQLQIPLEIAETDEQLENDIRDFIKAIGEISNFLGSYCFIAYTGNFDLKPSLEQRLMEHLAVPIYTVRSNNGPLNRRYKKAENMVIVLFSGLDDPTLAALNDTELSCDRQVFCFLYVPRNHDNRLLTMDEMWHFFSWCWRHKVDRVLLFVRGESEIEVWTYFSFSNISLIRLTNYNYFENFLRGQSYKFTVQAANDIPTILWYNSSEQADVIGGGNISLSGPIGIMMVEFMRYINASMDILPIQEDQNSNYEIQAPTNQRVDIVANLVVNDSLLFCPVVTDTQICLVVPHRREIPLSRYFDKAIDSSVHFLMLAILFLAFVIKYISHRRRSMVASIFNALRFSLAMPLPGGQLERLPLADKIIEVYSLLFLAICISTFGSFLSSALTAGIYYPPITDVESMRASGLRIITSDPTVQQAFKDNRMPSSLADLVDLVDSPTIFKELKNLNESVAFVVRTPNWQGLRLYQERLRTKRHSIAGSELCSNTRHLRLPISPHSALRDTFNAYFYKIFESGLQQKWLRMGFQKFRELFDITKLPTDTDNEWKPLTISFYTVFIRIYIGGMLLSTLVFLIELLYKRYSIW